MSEGRPPPALMLDRDVAAAGLRALLSVPKGVDEGVIDAIAGGSETERRDGSRGVLKFDSWAPEESGETVDEGELEKECAGSRESFFEVSLDAILEHYVYTVGMEKVVV